MAARFLSLEEAAAQLGMTPEQVKELRDAGEIHGYRDGASWKFKPEEVERVAAERSGGGNASDDLSLDDLLAIDESDSGELDLSDLGDLAGGDELGDLDESSILVTEEPPQDAGESSSTIIGREEASAEPVSEAASESDLQLAPSDAGTPGDPSSDSEEFVLADSDDDVKAGSSGEGVELVDSGELDELQLAPEGSSDSDDFELSSDELLLEGEDKLAAAAKDLALSDDDDLLLGADSGSGSDDDFELSSGESGISLAGADLDRVVLDESSASESDDFDLELSDDSMVVPAQASSSDDDSESLQPDEEFLLTPAEDLLSDESSDSGSQVIALDDSESGSADLTPMLVPAGSADSGEGVVPELQPFQTAGGAAAYPTESLPEAEYSILMMIWLSVLTITLMALGMVLFDIVRNMWSWQGQFATTSWLTDALVSALQLDK